MKTILMSILTTICISFYAQDTLPHFTYLDTIRLYVHPEINAEGIQWGGYGTNIVGISDGINGLVNTNIITEQLGDNGGVPYAAKLCDTLTAYGYDDWYLPANNELHLICQKIDSLGLEWIGETSIYAYWSSNQTNETIADQIIPDYCMTYNNPKNSLHNCRCVRREIITSIKEKTKDEKVAINYYSNTQEVQIENTQGKKTQIEVIDINGRVVMARFDISSEEKVKLSSLLNGIYIIKVTGDEFSESKKIIIKK